MTEETLAVGVIHRNADGSFDSRLSRHYEGHHHDRVWAMLTEPAGIAQWIAPGTIEQHPGGRVKIDFADSGILIDSTVLEIDPGRVLAYSWSSGDEPARPLRWELEDRDGGCTLHLQVHTPAGEDPAKACAGFEGHLLMLAGALEGVPIKFPFAAYVAARAQYNQQLEAPSS